jgi:hypothetical protein
MAIARWLVAALLVSVTGGVPARAAEPVDHDVEILVDAIRANKKALVAANLGLTPEEAAKFWPLYDRYQTELNAVQDRLAKVVVQYTAGFRTIPDADALKLAQDYLTVEADRAKVRQSYLEPFSKVLTGRKVVRFYQIENKMDAVLRYDLAETIPVMDE